MGPRGEYGPAPGPHACTPEVAELFGGGASSEELPGELEVRVSLCACTQQRTSLLTDQ
jgi:hypothetical protein